MNEFKKFFNNKSSESLELNPLIKKISINNELVEVVENKEIIKNKNVSEIIRITQEDIDELQIKYDALSIAVDKLKIAKEDPGIIRKIENKVEPIRLEILDKQEEIQAIREEFNCW